MLACVTISIIFIFCIMVVGHVTRSLYCFITLVMVVWVCVFHCSKGTRLIPR